jgi:four helix bundle protein
MKNFKDLEVWKKGGALGFDISVLTKTFPSDEEFKLIDQMIRASLSVTANLAEGYGRFQYQENVQFCPTLRGSLTEIQDHLTVAYEEEYINEELVKKI